MIPLPLTGSYDVTARFIRESGAGKVGFTLPTGRTAVHLVFGKPERKVHGLGKIRGKDPGANETAVRPGTLINGKEYAVDVRVRLQGDQVSIEADLDGKTLIRWKGPQAHLSLHVNCRLPALRCMGLAANSPTVFRSVKIRLLDGGATPVNHEPGGSIRLGPNDATLHGEELFVETRPGMSFPNIGRWTDADEWVSWTVAVAEAGTYKIHGKLSSVGPKTKEFTLDIAGRTLAGKGEKTKDNDDYRLVTIGKVVLPAGEHILTMRPKVGRWGPINVAFLELRRVGDGPSPGTVVAPGEGKIVGVDKLAELKGHATHVRSLAFDPSGQTLASVAIKEKTVRLWDLAAKKSRGVLRGHAGEVIRIAVSVDGILASVGADKAVALWDVQTGKLKKAMKGHGGLVSAVAFSPSGQLLATGADDKTVRTWDVRTGKPRHVLKGHVARITLLAFDAEGKTLVSFARGKGNKGRRWDVLTGQQRGLVASLRNHETARAGISADATTLAQVSIDAGISIHDLVPPPEPRKRKKTWHGRRCSEVALSSDGRVLASGGNEELSSKECFVRLWDARTGQILVKSFDKQKSKVARAAFSPDGQLLAVGRGNGTITLWKLRYEAPASAEVGPPRPPVSGKKIVVKVLPQNWQRFGKVTKGRTLSLTAEGQWQDGSTIRPTTGPEGTLGGASGKKRILYLEARVAGKTYKVGKGRTILVEKDGWLEMRMMRASESIYKTSGPKATGFMTVTIEER